MNATRPTPPPKTWTTRDLLAWISSALAERDVESPRLLAEMLLAHVLGCERMTLYTQADRPATPLERNTLRELVARALKHEPVQYLVAEAWFFSLPFRVDRHVLIPRPCTETIVEHVLQHARNTPGFTEPAIADLCTGSACIAVALLKNLPGARAFATDLSPDALEVARTNAERHDVTDRIELLEGDLLAPLEAHPAANQFHYITANPPYIPDHEWNDPAMMGKNVKGHEPDLALRGGPDGLACVRPIIETTPKILRPQGLLLIEIAESTAEAALAIAKANPLLENPTILNDLEARPRVLLAARSD